MALTEAQKRAKEKYNSKVTKVSIEFYPSDEMLLLHLKHQENKQAYIKELIRKDMTDFKSVRNVEIERQREIGRLQERTAQKLADAKAKVATQGIE
jgi:hypothetical protein